MTARRNARIDRRLKSRREERGQRGNGGREGREGREGGVVPSSWRQALVRDGGRLGRLEGVPFQTLRIDLFVDGAPSLHPLLVVVDHVLELFQRPFYPPSLQATRRFSRTGSGAKEEEEGRDRYNN